LIFIFAFRWIQLFSDVNFCRWQGVKVFLRMSMACFLFLLSDGFNYFKMWISVDDREWDSERIHQIIYNINFINRMQLFCFFFLQIEE
jgi:hypothetical protein